MLLTHKANEVVVQLEAKCNELQRRVLVEAIAKMLFTNLKTETNIDGQDAIEGL